MSATEEADSNYAGKSGKSNDGEVASTPDGGAHLTHREIEVLKWVREGKRDSEIATVLGVSVRTINKHVQSILSKLRVETRTAAALYAVRPSSRLREDEDRGPFPKRES